VIRDQLRASRYVPELAMIMKLAEAARLGAFLEAAEKQGKDDEDRDQQHDPQQTAPGSRSRPGSAVAPAEQGPGHTHVYARAQRNMPAVPNYLSRPG
jgi:hypothetical protein